MKRKQTKREVALLFTMPAIIFLALVLYGLEIWSPHQRTFNVLVLLLGFSYFCDEAFERWK